jgi:hypothetical protein
MKFLIAIIGWCVLWALCWPIALLVLLFSPVLVVIGLLVWLLAAVGRGLFAFLEALFMLPARLLGSKR